LMMMLMLLMMIKHHNVLCRLQAVTTP